jgi:hypothetical protein
LGTLQHAKHLLGNTFLLVAKMREHCEIQTFRLLNQGETIDFHF